MRVPSSWLLVGVLLGLWAPMCRAGGMSDYLTTAGQLKYTLEFQDVQGGVAGFTGTARIIEPSGEWRVVRFHNTPLGTPLRQGKLTEAQIAALATHLAAQDFLALPRQLGSETLVNPRQLTIRFGDKATTMGWRPLADLTEAVPPPKDPHTAEWAKFVVLVLVIDYWTKGEKPDGKEHLK